MEWWHILLIVVGSLLLLFVLSIVLYKPFFKRFWDIILSGTALLILSPLLCVLVVLGLIFMKGNPFFTQDRPGKRNKSGKERIFKLIKFRSMTNAKDENGKLLPDEKRLGRYGKFLRATSLDELPELLNIFIGDMSIVGPRPLLVTYLPFYFGEEKIRHNVRPGLTGLAQINGRNFCDWDTRLQYDVKYVKNLSLFGDISIIFKTILKVLSRSGVSEKRITPLDEERRDRTEEQL